MRSKNKQKKQISAFSQQLHHRFVIPNHSASLCFQTIFGNQQPLSLEIGFGNGEVLLHSAQQQPHTNFIGVEIYSVGILNALAAMHRGPTPPNLRLFHGDARLFYLLVADESFSEIRVLYSDPWNKHRHQSRRLIDDDFLRDSIGKLAVGGRLLIRTDVPDYGRDIARAIQPLAAMAPVKWAAADFELPSSKYERLGKLRHPDSYSFIIEKRSSPF